MLLEKTLRSAADLAEAGLIAPARGADLDKVAARYAIAITPTSAGLIDPADPADPIARQFLPDLAELAEGADDLADPIGDGPHSPVPGIIHRYPDRVLLMLTHTCATYCRFCFRRETVGPSGGGNLSPAKLKGALAYIESDVGIWEVILSGGDPLILSPRRLGAVMAALGAIDHVKVVRLHSRVPAVEPDLITPGMVRTLKRSGKAVYVALHANHPRELTPAVRAACARLIDAGIPMLSQSVLLRGVNDDPEVLGDLMRAFVETRIKPYYLHQADLAPGTAHLRKSLEDGQAVVNAIRGHISGLCQPTYVLDIPGGYGKVPVGPTYLTTGADGQSVVVDPWGQPHRLPRSRNRPHLTRKSASPERVPNG
jgi:lysine 2,3-aminomutase